MLPGVLNGGTLASLALKNSGMAKQEILEVVSSLAYYGVDSGPCL